METVTFTCTAPGTLLRWRLSDTPAVIDVDTFLTPLNMPLMPQPGYTLTLTAFNDTTIASTLSGFT